MQRGQEPKPENKLTMADIQNGLIREIQYQSSAAHVYATAAEHQVACGMGAFRITTEYLDEESFDQVIRLRAIPQPLNVYWDPAAVEYDRSDAEWCIITQLIPRETFKQRYPKASETGVETSDEFKQNELYWTSADDVRIAEYWVKTYEKKTITHPGTGQTRETRVPKVKLYIVNGGEILEGPYDWVGRDIPIIPVIGSEIPLERRTYRYGLIRFARDPQLLYNYARTSAAEAMSQAPKSPWLVTTKMIGKYKQIWNTVHKTLLPYLPYDPDPDAPAGPQRQPGPEIPAAFVNEAGIADGDIKATVGIYDPQLGQRSSENSGRAILAREKQGDTGTFHYSDNLRRSLEYAGKILVDIIPKVYDSERVIRILGEDEAEMYAQINVVRGIDEMGRPIVVNDMAANKYDCRVKIGPSYATKRMESADSLMQFMQAFPDASPAIADLVATNMDWPGSQAIAERLRRMVPPQILGEQDEQEPEEDPAQELAMEGAQLELRELAAKVEKLESENDKIRAETSKILADIDQRGAEFERDDARYEIDRDDRLSEAEAARVARFEEMRMRQQPQWLAT